MHTWRSKASELLRQWQVARARRRQARDALRDQRATDDLERSRSGADRFPPMGGGV